MLHDFRRHMKAYGMRAGQDSFMWAILSTPLDALDEAFKPGTAIRKLFSFRARRGTRLEAELGAPGHEVAYIASSHNRFT